MRKSLFIISNIFTVTAGIAHADIPVTVQQKQILETKLSQLGCSGGYMQFDQSDNHFEVNNATCDGQRFDLTFSRNYTLLEKDLED
ncbi:hypothetical protein [Ochrobactrum sp. POC9]|uniref:hypothetical protein n=1 Tax=unclassified Ochrobactrum TaxID=239106 RepID=UPI0011B20827|nr:hypothetical protein [Ochrobactrum sp. POC9]MCH4538784.1 hypothetical protein [Ochrobactrum sp. A-1]